MTTIDHHHPERNQQMSEKPLDLDSVQHQIDAVQIETWLPLPVVRVLELAPVMLQEIKDLRQQLTEGIKS